MLQLTLLCHGYALLPQASRNQPLLDSNFSLTFWSLPKMTASGLCSLTGQRECCRDLTFCLCSETLPREEQSQLCFHIVRGIIDEYFFVFKSFYFIITNLKGGSAVQLSWFFTHFHHKSIICSFWLTVRWTEMERWLSGEESVPFLWAQFSP